ncbi:MAG: patatin-like phospholipase family protein [Acidobacteriia bacterium]|nr:patatin-like phospholipase family protein [Terriglobia bacterium]
MEFPKTSRPKIGIALSGGAVRGFAHIGVLRVLHRAKIPIDFLVGTSIGSVIGAAYASGTSFDEMEEICAAMRWRDVARWTFSKRGLASIEKNDALLDRLIRVETFDKLRIPFYAVATDIRTGELIVLSRGDLKTAVRASCAIPGLFVPVKIQGRDLVDGGVCANLPVLPLQKLGADKIIAVDVSAHIDTARPPATVYEILVQSMLLIGRAAARHARSGADLIVEPDVGQFSWDDFNHCGDLVHAGDSAMRKLLPTVQSWLPDRKVSLWSRLRAKLRS